ncbi:MAG: hypothetical protein NXI27_01265 [Alphaproteobacteria bacterium]|nr:hypothetical protein [Alphaproteobacteria bacterium]
MISRMRRIYSSVAVQVLAAIFSAILFVWCALLRRNTEQIAKIDWYINGGNRLLALFWHGKYIPLFALAKGKDAVVLTNDSFRGRVIAGICRWFGYRPILLPSDRKHHGFAVLLELFSTRPNLTALALDGPLGPYHCVRTGALRSAARNGVKIVPIGVASQRKFILTSRWDLREVPLPFTKIAVAVGDMIDAGSIVADSGQPSLEELIRTGMDRAEQQAEKILVDTEPRSSA